MITTFVTVKSRLYYLVFLFFKHFYTPMLKF